MPPSITGTPLEFQAITTADFYLSKRPRSAAGLLLFVHDHVRVVAAALQAIAMSAPMLRDDKARAGKSALILAHLVDCTQALTPARATIPASIADLVPGLALISRLIGPERFTAEQRVEAGRCAVMFEAHALALYLGVMPSEREEVADHA